MTLQHEAVIEQAESDANYLLGMRQPGIAKTMRDLLAIVKVLLDENAELDHKYATAICLTLELQASENRLQHQLSEQAKEITRLEEQYALMFERLTAAGRELNEQRAATAERKQ